MSLSEIDIGFVPLTDAATLIVAKEMGFAAEEGLELNLHKEVSWSNIRDKVSMGIYPIAHMLSPLALAMSLGLGPMPVRITVPFVLSQNGNTLVAGPELVQKLGDVARDAASLGRHLALEIARGFSLNIGVPFPQSMHRELVRYWLEACGVEEPGSVSFSVASPSMLGKVLAANEIDAFMVGEPWGSLAVEQGNTEILLCGSAIWSAAPEKVLAVRDDWATDNSEALQRLIRALYRASLWVGDQKNAMSTAEILSLPQYVDVGSEIIEHALTGELVIDGKGRVGKREGILRLSGPTVTFPWISGATWIADRVAQHWGLSRTAVRIEAESMFRPDLYRQALDVLGVNTPASDSRIEGGLVDTKTIDGTHGPLFADADSFFDGRKFDFSA